MRTIAGLAVSCFLVCALRGAAPPGFDTGSIVLYQTDQTLVLRLPSPKALADYTKQLQKVYGLFTRVCLETEEGPHHILYSLFWGSNDLDMFVISIAGTPKELWDQFSPTFDRMSGFELVDAKALKAAEK